MAKKGGKRVMDGVLAINGKERWRYRDIDAEISRKKAPTIGSIINSRLKQEGIWICPEQPAIYTFYIDISKSIKIKVSDFIDKKAAWWF